LHAISDTCHKAGKATSNTKIPIEQSAGIDHGKFV